MRIQIWTGEKWEDKALYPDIEAEEIADLLRKEGLKVLLVPDAFPKRPSSLEENILKALLGVV